MLAARRATCILGCIKGGLASREREVIIPIYSALIRLHLVYCIQAKGSQHKKDMELLEWIQRRAMKMRKGLGEPVCRKAEKAGLIWPGELKALWRPPCGLSIIKWGL